MGRGQGKIVKLYFWSNPRWRTAPNFRFLNRYNSAVDYALSLAECACTAHIWYRVKHVSADTLQTFEVKGSEVKVTA